MLETHTAIRRSCCVSGVKGSAPRNFGTNSFYCFILGVVEKFSLRKGDVIFVS
jgi:hypothetical protein